MHLKYVLNIDIEKFSNDFRDVTEKTYLIYRQDHYLFFSVVKRYKYFLTPIILIDNIPNSFSK